MRAADAEFKAKRRRVSMAGSVYGQGFVRVKQVGPFRLKAVPPQAMTLRFSRIRRFHFNLPQRIAAGFLVLFLIQGFWLIDHQTLTDRDYQYARCGREMWERPEALTGYYTTCGNIHDGVLGYRLAGLPLTLNLLVERGLDLLRKPEDKVIQAGVPRPTGGAPRGSSSVGWEPGGEVSTWELRHQMTQVLLLMRLPFLLAGCLLGGGLWWV